MTPTTDATAISPEQLLAAWGGVAIWPVAVIMLVVVALSLLPRDERVAGLRALADLVRAARGRGPEFGSRPTSRGTVAQPEEDDDAGEAADVPVQRRARGGSPQDTDTTPPVAR